MKFLNWIENKLSTVENYSLVFLLTTMVVLSCLQVILRNVFDSGFFWADQFLRHLVLWVALLGASQATKSMKHINIDVFSRLLKDKTKKIVQTCTYIFSLIVTCILSKAAWEFIAMERESEIDFIWGLNTWIFKLIIPIGMTLICFRFIVNIFNLFSNENQESKK